MPQDWSFSAKDPQALPPTSSALAEHTKRAVLQAGFIWGQCLIQSPCLPDPTEWGLVKKDVGFLPKWMTLPEAALSCSELVHCGCKKGCTSARCTCKRSVMPCTMLCAFIAKCGQKY